MDESSVDAMLSTMSKFVQDKINTRVSAYKAELESDPAKHGAARVAAAVLQFKKTMVSYIYQQTAAKNPSGARVTKALSPSRRPDPPVGSTPTQREVPSMHVQETVQLEQKRANNAQSSTRPLMRAGASSSATASHVGQVHNLHQQPTVYQQPMVNQQYTAYQPYTAPKHPLYQQSMVYQNPPSYQAPSMQNRQRVAYQSGSFFQGPVMAQPPANRTELGYVEGTDYIGFTPAETNVGPRQGLTAGHYAKDRKGKKQAGKVFQGNVDETDAQTAWNRAGVPKGPRKKVSPTAAPQGKPSIEIGDDLTDEERMRRQMRRDRFSSKNATSSTKETFTPPEAQSGSAASASDEAEAAGETTGGIIGTCHVLEKAYVRLTGPPVASKVRPQPVLAEWLNRLSAMWKEVHREIRENRTPAPSMPTWAYISDQLRAIRQDMTVQGMGGDAFALKVYVENARMALEAQDLGPFHQCQTKVLEILKKRIDSDDRVRERDDKVPVSDGSSYSLGETSARFFILPETRDLLGEFLAYQVIYATCNDMVVDQVQTLKYFHDVARMYCVEYGEKEQGKAVSLSSDTSLTCRLAFVERVRTAYIRRDYRGFESLAEDLNDRGAKGDNPTLRGRPDHAVYLIRMFLPKLLFLAVAQILSCTRKSIALLSEMGPLLELPGSWFMANIQEPGVRDLSECLAFREHGSPRADRPPDRHEKFVDCEKSLRNLLSSPVLAGSKSSMHG